MRWLVITMVLITALIVVLAVMIGSAASGGARHRARVPRLRQGAPDTTSLVISARVPS
jgi:hypothetical protein